MSLPYIGRIEVDYGRREVRWIMSASEARALAHGTRDTVRWDDLAMRDADALDEAAERLEPDDGADQERTIR